MITWVLLTVSMVGAIWLYSRTLVRMRTGIACARGLAGYATVAGEMDKGYTGYLFLLDSVYDPASCGNASRLADLLHQHGGRLLACDYNDLLNHRPDLQVRLKAEYFPALVALRDGKAVGGTLLPATPAFLDKADHLLKVTAPLLSREGAGQLSHSERTGPNVPPSTHAEEV